MELIASQAGMVLTDKEAAPPTFRGSRLQYRNNQFPFFTAEFNFSRGIIADSTP